MSSLQEELQNYQRLPITNIRDLINIIRQDIKYKLIPFRFYYKLRAKKYATHKTPELNLIKHLINKDQVSLDIGANLGLFTYFMSKYSLKVYAFEPNPYPLRYLPNLIDSNVELMKIAVSDSNQKMNLLIPKSSKGWSSNGATLKNISVKNGIKIKVDCRTIDSFNFSNVGLIKIDVEGAEKEVLMGARNTLINTKSNLIIENELIHQNDANEIFQITSQMGYKIFYFHQSKLKKINENTNLQDIQKNPQHKVIGYIQNFIFIHDENLSKFKDLIND